ncbi:MAG: NTP transferase domain-containing protein [Acidobacteriota bacterium]
MGPSLLFLAAGMGSRFGGLKQLEPLGPDGETLLDYLVYDGLQAGFTKVVFVIRQSFEEDFRKKVTRSFEDRVQVALAHQALDDLPEGFRPPEGREKPWGTAHATWSARNDIGGPFALLNADDFYGREALSLLADELRAERPPGPRERHCMVGFTLGKTVSEHGSVSRGTCTVDDDGFLSSIVELTRIEQTERGLENTAPENPRLLTGEEPVSMNCWGFARSFLDHLDEALPTFLQEHGENERSEFGVPTEVNRLIEADRAEVKVLRTASSWFGLTNRGDLDRAKAAMQELIEAGVYPAPLWG